MIPSDPDDRMPGVDQPYRVFISYRRDDTFWAAWSLKSALPASDMDVFADVDLRLGTSWSHQLAEEVLKAHVVVLLIGARPDLSPWVQHEIRFAKHHHIPVIPTLVEPEAGSEAAQLDELVGRIQYKFSKSIGMTEQLEQFRKEIKRTVDDSIRAGDHWSRRRVDGSQFPRHPFVKERYVKEILWSLEKHRAVCLLGEDGCGKYWLSQHIAESKSVFERYFNRRVIVDLTESTSLRGVESLEQHIAEKLFKTWWKDAPRALIDKPAAERPALQEYLPFGVFVVLRLGELLLPPVEMRDFVKRIIGAGKSKVLLVSRSPLDGVPAVHPRRIDVEEAEAWEVYRDASGHEHDEHGQQPRGFTRDLSEARQMGFKYQNVNWDGPACDLLSLFPSGMSERLRSKLTDRTRRAIDSLKHGAPIEDRRARLSVAGMFFRGNADPDDLACLLSEYERANATFRAGLSTDESEAASAVAWLSVEIDGLHGIIQKILSTESYSDDLRRRAVETTIDLVDFHRMGIGQQVDSFMLNEFWKTVVDAAGELDAKDLKARCFEARGWVRDWHRIPGAENDFKAARQYFDGDRNTFCSAKCLEGLGHVIYNRGDNTRLALDWMRQAWREYGNDAASDQSKSASSITPGAKCIARASCEMHLGRMYMELCDFEEALNWLTVAVATLNGCPGRQGPGTLDVAIGAYEVACHRRLGDVERWRSNDSERARLHYENSLSVPLAASVVDEHIAAQIGKGWASLSRAGRDIEGAMRAFRDASRSASARASRADALLAEAHLGLGWAAVHAGQQAGAMDELRTAEKLVHEPFGIDKRDRLVLETLLRHAHMELDNFPRCDDAANDCDAMGTSRLTERQRAWLHLFSARLSRRNETRASLVRNARRLHRQIEGGDPVLASRLDTEFAEGA